MAAYTQEPPMICMPLRVAVPGHSNCSRPSVGDEMLNSSRKPGSYHLLVGQQGQDREEDDAAPGEGPKRCVHRAGAHRSTFIGTVAHPARLWPSLKSRIIG